MTTIYIVEHTAIIGLCLVNIGTWLYWAQKRHQYFIAIPIILWVISAGLFSLARLMNLQFTPTFLNSWSLGIRLQALLTFAGVGIYLAVKQINFNGKA